MALPARQSPTMHNIGGQLYLLGGGQLYSAPGGHSPHMHLLVIYEVSCFFHLAASSKTARPIKILPLFYMKHWIDLCALCLSLGKINHDFSPTSEAGQKDSFGLFSVRAMLPVAKNLFTYAVDENLFFEVNGEASEYSKLDALETVWRGKLPAKDKKSAP
jgi:hypothetical protein